MVEATWGDAASPAIDWRMSAALENVSRGQDELAEVTSLERAVRDWLALDPAHQADAILTPERPLLIEGVSMVDVRGDHIGALAAELPGSATAIAGNDEGVDEAG